MTETAENLEIEVEDLPDVILDDAAEPQNQPVDGKKPDPAPETPAEPSDGIDELRANLETARKAEQEALRVAQFERERAAKAEKEAETGRSQGIDGQIQHLASAAEQIKARGEVLKRDYKEALQSGDYDKVTEIQEKMSELAVDKRDVDRGRQHLERLKAQPRPEPKPAASSDPVEALAARLTPKSAEWVRKHPDYASDPAKYRQMLAADSFARARGHDADSEGYFGAVEEALGLNKPEPKAEVAKPAAPAKPASVSAPVSRSVPNAPPSPDKVRLSQDEIEMGRRMGLSREDIARAKLVQARQKSAA